MFVFQRNEADPIRRRLYFRMVATFDNSFMTGIPDANFIKQVWKNGVFSPAGGSVVEMGSGVYYYQATVTDLDTLGSFIFVPIVAGAWEFAYERMVISDDVMDPGATPISVRQEMDANSTRLALLDTLATAEALAAARVVVDQIQAIAAELPDGGSLQSHADALTAILTHAEATRLKSDQLNFTTEGLLDVAIKRVGNRNITGSGIPNVDPWKAV